MISVVLVGSEKEENVGRVARVMKNFGFERLILINPRCNHLGNKALALASHADDVLKEAEIKGEEGFSDFDCLVGTTAILGSDSHIPRSPLLPRDAARIISKKNSRIALLFGRESCGLTTGEILKCDILITIPTAKRYPTMNLSQAVGILLYEIFLAQIHSKGKEHVSSHIRFADGREKEILIWHINEVLGSLDFPSKAKKETQRKAWKRVIGKSFLTKKEFMVLMGFFKKIFKRR